MHSRILRIVPAALLVLLLAVTFLLNHRNSQSGIQPAVNTADAMKRYGFHLAEVSHQAGVDFVHVAPTLDAKLSNIMPQVASMGASVTVVDYDNDGWPDLYVTTSNEGGKNRLYHNNHDGTFTDVAPQMGIADVNKPGTGVSMGAVWGDYDNDGYEDLLLYKWGKPELFHNDHGKGFTRVTDKAGLPPWVNANSATWVDYDRDGRLDLLICGYYREGIDLWHLKNTRMMPDSLEYAKNGGRKFLLHNNGDGTFTDVTAKVGLNSRLWTLAVGAADLRGTGYPDLVLANDYGVTQLYANDHGQRFREIGEQTGIGYRPKSGMNVAFGDILNSGQQAIYISNINAPGNLIQGNNLWVPSASGDALHYDNWATDAGVELGGWSFGAQFGDLNNDGNLDIVLVNGYISHSRDKSYWYAYTKVSGGNAAIISDAQNWPPMGDMSLSGYEQKHLWLGDGTGKFTDAAQAVGMTDTHDGRSVALADLWNTGALDVIVANQDGPLRLYRNTADPNNKWLELQLTGTHANRSAIGAEVRLFWHDALGHEHQQMQEVSAASGFCAQNDRRLHFGLGPNPTLEKAVIRWPSPAGESQAVTSLQINHLNPIKEPS